MGPWFYTARGDLWALNVPGTNFGVAVVNGDGNVLVYKPGAKPVWNGGTADNPGNRLVVQDGIWSFPVPTTRRPADNKAIPAAKHRRDIGDLTLGGAP